MWIIVWYWQVLSVLLAKWTKVHKTSMLLSKDTRLVNDWPDTSLRKSLYKFLDTKKLYTGVSSLTNSSTFKNNFTTGNITFKLQKHFYNIFFQTTQNGLNDCENSFNMNFLICKK